MGSAHSYMKRHEGDLIKGGRLVGRGAGSWLPCPKGKVEASVGLCQIPCDPGYTSDGIMFCKRPDYTKPTRVLTPHPGICPSDRPYNIAGLCYGNPPPGYTRKVVGTLDQDCPSDQPEWKGYQNFNPVQDIGVSCQRATYTRDPSPTVKLIIKARLDRSDPPPPPLCSSIPIKREPVVCRENDVPPGKRIITDEKGQEKEVDTPAWAMTVDGTKYYKKCKSLYTYDDRFNRCGKQDPNHLSDDLDSRRYIDSYTPEYVRVNYIMRRFPFCSELDPKTNSPDTQCILNFPEKKTPDEEEWSFSNTGNFYYRCPKDYEFDEVPICDTTRTRECEKGSNMCIKWKPMSKKKMKFNVNGVITEMEVNDGGTLHKEREDTKEAEKVDIQYGTLSGMKKPKWWVEPREPIKHCNETETARKNNPTKKLQLCYQATNPGTDYELSADLANFYKKCRAVLPVKKELAPGEEEPPPPVQFEFDYNTKKCVKEGVPPEDTELVPTELKLLLTPVCSQIIPKDHNKDLLCRINDIPDFKTHSISEDGEMYYLNCAVEEEFYAPTKSCINRAKDTEHPTTTIPIQYGKPNGKRQLNISISYCSDISSKTEELCMENKAPEGYEISDNYKTYFKSCGSNEDYVTDPLMCVLNKDQTKTRKPTAGTKCNEGDAIKDGICTDKEGGDYYPVPTCDSDETLQYGESYCVDQKGNKRLPETVDIVYKLKQTDLCEDTPASANKDRLCRTTAPPPDYYLSKNGEEYIQYCAEGFEAKDGECKGENETYTPAAMEVEYKKV